MRCLGNSGNTPILKKCNWSGHYLILYSLSCCSTRAYCNYDCVSSVQLMVVSDELNFALLAGGNPRCHKSVAPRRARTGAVWLERARRGAGAPPGGDAAGGGAQQGWRGSTQRHPETVAALPTVVPLDDDKQCFRASPFCGSG